MQEKELKLFLFGEIVDKKALEIVEELHKTDKKIINLFINSDGGDVGAAIGIIDTILWYQKHGLIINTIACGRAYSSAADILVCGSTRFGTENSTYMLHPTSYAMDKDYDHVHKSAAVFWERYSADILELTLSKIKKAHRKNILENINSGIWLTTDEALTIGLIDKIWK